MIWSLSHGRVLFDSILSTHDLYNKLKNYPESLVLTVTRQSAAYINDMILKHISTNHPLALVVADDETSSVQRHETRDHSSCQYVHWLCQWTVCYSDSHLIQTIFATHPNGNIINIFPVTSIINDIQTTKYLRELATSSIIQKIF